jgi:hypothetical protein
MRLTLWQGIGLASLAAILIALAVFDASASPSCGGADAKLDAGLLADAEAAYGDVLDEEPASGCARIGMENVVRKLCGRAWAMTHAGHPDDAKKAYATAMAVEPSGDIQVDCRVSASTPDSTCEESEPKACVIVVPGPRGPRGYRGEPGDRGESGDRGQTGERGPRGRDGRDAYVPCCPG